MKRKNLIFIFLFAIITVSGPYSRTCFGEPSGVQTDQQDPVKENQILFNGKVWRNHYSYVKGDQFLFSKDYLPASLTINGQSFKNLLINYDIYNDEILTPSNHGEILQLNKEMVDSFTLVSGYKTYKFINTQEDSLSGIKGYVNVLYKGKSSLYVKYKKEIDLLAVDDKYDLFFQTLRIYILKDGIAHQIANRSDLLKVLMNDKTQIKDFMKKNKIRVSKREPESFITVIRYYDSISK